VNVTKQYFYKTLLTLVLATISFFIWKEFLPNKLFPIPQDKSKNVVVDSLLLEALSEVDTTSSKMIKEEIVYEAENGITFPPEDVEEYSGYQYLLNFYESLFQLESEKEGNVRIAYFSDSMTDGDMIVQDLRSLFQEKYGGMGVGFVNITSESASSRSSLKHEFSGNWKSQSYLKTKHPKDNFAVNGHVFYAHDTLPNSWVRYKASRMRFVKSLPKPTLYYGYSENKNGKVFRIVDGDTIEQNLSPDKKLNKLYFSDGNVNSLQVYFKEADSIPIYGFNFDDGKGVHVDNFSSRGNSGLPLSMFNKNLMNEFQKELGYDLIILHYGTNVLNYGSYNYGWYEKRMQKVVAHVKECFPNAEVLVISTADKAIKYDLEMKTDSAVVPLVKAQKRYAISSQSGFVNLYKAMGGENSMIKWVEEEPARANKDYTHFNYKGSVAIAKLIYNQIDKGYVEYKKLRKKKTVIVKLKNDSVVEQKDSIYAN
jgi:lysophospholipase L1-like esterase